MSSDTLLGLVRAFLADFEYKPDSTFDIQPEVYGLQLIMVRRIADSRDPKHPEIRVVGRLAVGEELMRAYDPKAAIQQRVHTWLIDMEIHELNEWFKVAGELPYDPHRRI